MENVKAVKLVTGEDLICQYTECDGIVEITDPMQVVPVGMRGEQPNFAFMPFPLFSSDKTLYVSRDKVLFVCEVAEEFLNQYTSIFSGIITPPKKLIV